MEYFIQIILAASIALIIFASLIGAGIVHRLLFKGTEDIDHELLIAIVAAVSQYRRRRMDG